MKTIDSHMTFLCEPNIEEALLSTMEHFDIYGNILFPDAKPTTRQAHDRLAAFIQRSPLRFWGIIDINPDSPEYEDEFSRCVEDLGFVGVKLNQDRVQDPLRKSADKVFEMAEKYRVPVIFHTSEALTATLPSMMIPRAMQFPNVKIVIEHAGSRLFFREAIIAAQTCNNIYLETSWCFTSQIRTIIEKLGANRVMFATDGHPNTRVSLVIAEEVGLSEMDKEQFFSNTATEVFKLKIN